MFKKYPTKNLVALSIANVLAFSASSAVASELQKVARPDSLTKLSSTERLQHSDNDLVEVFIEMNEEVVSASSGFAAQSRSGSVEGLNKLRGDMRKFRGTEMR